LNRLVKEQLSRLPRRPGVYLMRDSAANILYVGKAINLNNRVRSYFSGSAKLSPKTVKLVSQIADIDFFIASSEQEAMVLELNFIKQYRPRYNIQLKDDKTYPYLKIDIQDEWPRVYRTRRMEPDGGRYFGPFASSRSLKDTLRVLQRLFPFRVCKEPIKGTKARGCLEYYLGHCLAPCTGKVSKAEYDQVIKEVTMFLEGKRDKVIRKIRARMNQASENMDFEKAALLRDQVQAMEEVIEGERIAATIRGEQDVIAFVQDGDRAFVQVLFVRNNRLTGREGFLLQGTRDEEPGQIIGSFVKQYYSSTPQIPPLLLLQYSIDDKQIVEEWLKDRRGRSVKIQVPRRGIKKELVDIATENARQGWEQLKIKEMTTPRSMDEALDELMKELDLDRRPERMEAYDISNIQGTSAVGSMVVFEDGKPKPSHYRRFKIKSVSGANDYAMLQEVLERRFKRVGNRDEKSTGTWNILPDLVLIDGGKGQLNAALAVMEKAAPAIPVVSLAKENEEIFLPGRKKPVVLPRTSLGLQVLQQIRDEAHRFAIGYFSRLHQRKTFTSALDGIPGIGPRRKSALMRQFGSVPRIREATIEELVAATGMTARQAEKIKEYL
jgi:excinuclease ABC subunit C